MSYSNDVEIYKNICEKLINDNHNYNETTKIQLKAIIKSDDCGKVVFERVMAYLSRKGI